MNAGYGKVRSAAMAMVFWVGTVERMEHIGLQRGFPTSLIARVNRVVVLAVLYCTYAIHHCAAIQSI